MSSGAAGSIWNRGCGRAHDRYNAPASTRGRPGLVFAPAPGSGRDLVWLDTRYGHVSCRALGF